MVGPGLGRIGLLSYGDISWDASAQVTYEVTPIYDTLGEVLRYEHTVGVTGLIAFDCVDKSETSQPNTAINIIRARLSTPGLQFIHKGGGMGDLAVGPSTVIVQVDGVSINQDDIHNGPLPQVVTLRPMGVLACYVDWRLRFATTACLLNVSQGLRVLSIHSTISYSINESGLTTRSVQAVIKIQNELVAGDTPNKRMAANPDIYRDFFQIAKIPNFKRTEQSYTISEDRRELRVSISDSEIDSRNPYPVGTLHADVRHRVHVTQMNVGQIRQTLSGTVVCPQRSSIVAGLSVILELIKKRTAGGIVTDFELTEEVYGKNEVQFSVNYWQKVFQRVDNSPDLSRLFELTQLFSPTGLTVDGDFVPASWKAWQESMYDAKSSRGLAKAYFDGKSGSQGLWRAGGCYSGGAGHQATIVVDDGYLPPGGPIPILWGLENEKPDENESYQNYENEYEVKRYQKLVHGGYEQAPIDDVNTGGNELRFPGYSAGVTTPDMVTFMGQPDYRVVMMGAATRVSYQIPRPKLTSVGGALAYEIDGKFKTKQIGWQVNLPVYAAAWRIEYKLDRAPTVARAPDIYPPETNYES